MPYIRCTTGTDVSDTTAVASDVAVGKVFHLANGDRTTGTALRAAAEDITLSTTKLNKVTLGFKPKYLCVTTCSVSTTYYHTMIYNEELSTTEYAANSTAAASGSRGPGITMTALSYFNNLVSIDDDGFTLSMASSSRTYCRYFAVG